MYKVNQLFVYPIKSLGGIGLEKAQLSNSGFEYDRHWMLVHEDGKFISQREIPKLSLFRLSMTNGFVSVYFDGRELNIKKASEQGEEMNCSMFGDPLVGVKELDEYSDWFSQQLGENVLLVRRPSNNTRHVKDHSDASINFPDGGQYLLLGQGSLDYLNTKLDVDVSMNRFRPNIVFSHGHAHVEDEWQSVAIGNVAFEATKACGRCKITTVNQESGEMGKEPLQTLSKYRNFDNNVLFGQYLKLVEAPGKSISVGDELSILKMK